MQESNDGEMHDVEPTLIQQNEDSQSTEAKPARSPKKKKKTKEKTQVDLIYCLFVVQ